MKTTQRINDSAYLSADKSVLALPLEVDNGDVRYGLYEMISGSPFVVATEPVGSFMKKYPVRFESNMIHLLPRNGNLVDRVLKRIPYVDEPRTDEMTGSD